LAAIGATAAWVARRVRQNSSLAWTETRQKSIDHGDRGGRLVPGGGSARVMERSSLVRRVPRGLKEVVTSSRIRRMLLLRLERPDNLFQPYNDTYADRYPEIFTFLAGEIPDGPDVRLLSFGCSVGDEVFSLRAAFPTATVRGLDISARNINDSERRRRRSGDERLSFARANSTGNEPTGAYDAILAMAVLRHGDLSRSRVSSCEHRITFAAFERTVADFARCLKPGGILVIEHSNFRFADSATSSGFDCVLSLLKPPFDPDNPLFGPDNRRLAVPSYDEVAFRKRPRGPTG
jgi:2-polyprenyl-3-methyl-5-hydroxy-6-metoxy-1,4-benzoquinol methylase